MDFLSFSRPPPPACIFDQHSLPDSPVATSKLKCAMQFDATTESSGPAAGEVDNQVRATRVLMICGSSLRRVKHRRTGEVWYKYKVRDLVRRKRNIDSTMETMSFGESMEILEIILPGTCAVEGVRL
ncbi:hypothetical protein C8Q80DRAFT_1353530 [Daedaleopsis nitida]|nr:hypothetical protein C8Q80DRAFT_1353530 [Daedaleopsis nitida]